MAARHNKQNNRGVSWLIFLVSLVVITATVALTGSLAFAGLPPAGPPPSVPQTDYNATYDASSGLFPGDICPMWTLNDSATPEEPSVGGGKLTLSTSVNAENMLYVQSTWEISITNPLVIEVRAKFVSGSSSHAAHAPMGIAFTTAPNVGNVLYIGQDIMFIDSAELVRGASAVVDTDGTAHTYRIEVSGSAVQVFYDDVLTLTGSTYTSANDHGSAARIQWGDVSSRAFGISEWQSVRHNASTVTCNCGLDWRLVPSPNTANPTLNHELLAVDALNSDYIWALGWYTTRFAWSQIWNGTNWSEVALARAGCGGGAVFNQIDGVEVLSPNDAWAVGYYYNNCVQGERSLVQHWDGTTWAWIPSPNPGGGSAWTRWVDVKAVSATDVWAVGFARLGPLGNFNRTAVQRWDGTAWNLVSSPNIGTNHNELYDVAVASPNNVLAVGGARPGSLAMRWDGANWTLVPSGNIGTEGNYLVGLASVSATDGWAVGYYNNTGSPARTLIERWDGTQWSIVPSPNIGVNENQLNDVAVVSPTDVWAAGTYSETGQLRTLMEHWDGTSWQVVPSPNIGTGRNTLNAITAISADDIWAVGNYHNGTALKTLTMHYSFVPCPPTPTSTPTLTNTPTNTATHTPSLTPTATVTPSDTATATSTSTSTYTPTSTATVIPTSTATFTATDTATATSTSTNTFTPTSTVINTATSTHTATSTETATSTPSSTSTFTSTATDTPTRTSTPTNTATSTATNSPTVTPTSTPTNTYTPTNTPTFTRTSTATTTSTTVATPGSGQGCNFSIQSFEPCMVSEACVQYSIPLKNSANTGVTVQGTIRLLGVDDRVLAEGPMPPTYLPPRSTIFVPGVMCAPNESIKRVQVEVVIPDRACEVKRKTQPVRDVCPTSTPTSSPIP